MDLELYSQVKSSVKQILGIDLNHYKDEQMRRRLDSWLVRSGEPNWERYFSRLRADSSELSRFRNYLTINVSEFFRDAERWQTLRTKILPDLIKESRAPSHLSGLRIFSAGCSIGPEPYSLAIIMNEVARGQPFTLIATDLDRGALSKAQARGPYTVEEIRNVTPEQRAAFFETGGPPFYVTAKLSRQISFREQNLLQDPFDSNFDLVVCRNVIIYFTFEAKAVLYDKFSRALRPGGILFLGGTEIIPKPQEYSLQSFGISFYKKV
ncbi:MAG TPA: protein-glutamate O-methyltransferase CheR [Anaerolineaceae bacterium]|nr:protein-glutamate O-methyltransferase CheR [Anaerolineaceae bacterium]